MIWFFILINLAQAQSGDAGALVNHSPIYPKAFAKDESFPTYDDATGKNNRRCYDDGEFEQRRMERWKKINRMKKKQQDIAMAAQGTCDAHRFQACAGLDREYWNLHDKGYFREGIKAGCLWK